MNSLNIFGVRVDKVTQPEALELIEGWLGEKRKRVVVTPNIEFLMLARQEPQFKKLLNKADLAIPDSARFSWIAEFQKANLLLKILIWPLFPIAGALFRSFPVTTGTDLMESLVAKSAEKGFRIGFFGSKSEVAERLVERLKAKFPKIKISYTIGSIQVDQNGQMNEEILTKLHTPVDLLFVALGQGKQERWIDNYKAKIPATVFMGVGGAFDYLSGDVQRAPKWIQNLGLEWAFRGIKEPWRMKRFINLVKFVFLLIFDKNR